MNSKKIISSLILHTPLFTFKELSPHLAKHTPMDLHHVGADLMTIEPEKSIGIEDIRQLRSFLNHPPLGQPVRLGLVLQAHTMTVPAQNALLKTLEEPPMHAQIILVTASPSKLLETIISRCVLRKLTDQVPERIKSNGIHISQISQLSYGQKVVFSETKAKDLTTARSFVEEMIRHLREQMIDNPSQAHLYNLTLALYSLKLLNANVNPKLAVDSLLFYLKKP